MMLVPGMIGSTVPINPTANKTIVRNHQKSCTGMPLTLIYQARRLQASFRSRRTMQKSPLQKTYEKYPYPAADETALTKERWNLPPMDAVETGRPEFRA